MGLQLVHDRLVVSYGMGDATSRIWSMPFASFNAYFFRHSTAAPLMDELRAYVKAVGGGRILRKL